MAPAGELLGEARGSFLGLVARAYAYPFNPKVLLLTLLVAAVISFIEVTLRIQPGVSWLLQMGLTTGYGFALIRHASLGRTGVPILGSDLSDPSEMFISAGRIMLIFTIPIAIKLAVLQPTDLREIVLAAVQPLPLSEYPAWGLALQIAWFVYLPAAFLLASISTGCLGGMHFVGGFRLIMRLPGPYLMLFAAFLPLGAGVLVLGLLEMLAASGAWRSWGAVALTLAFSFAQLLVIAAGARLLGGFLWQYEEDLGLA